MNDSKISVRYAKALFNTAILSNELDKFFSDMNLISDLCSNKEFDSFLKSPIIQVSKKIAIFENVFKNIVHKTVFDFLVLLTKNRREDYLKLICLNFLKLYRDFKGIVKVELTTAVEIQKESQQNIIKLLKQFLQAEIEIQNITKPEIIGGFVIKIDDKQIDASVSTQLNTIRKELTKHI